MDYKDAANLATQTGDIFISIISFFCEKSIKVSFLPSKYKLSF